MYSIHEIIALYILPSIRREVVLVLKEKGFKNKDIAEMLNLTPAAVSQYLKGKRTGKDLDEEIKKNIRKNILSLNNEEVNKEILFSIIKNILELMKKEEKICKICDKLHENEDNEDLKCNFCIR